MEEVTLEQVLEARERRVMRQAELLGQFGGAMVCFTMNIAGPVKNSGLIRQGFRLGCRLLRQQLARIRASILHWEQIDEVTGCEAYCVTAADPMELKRITTRLEDGTVCGRLFDLDVLQADGSKMERGALGLSERPCLVCGGPAGSCARSRAHRVEELQQKTTLLLRRAVDEADARDAARLACQSLLYEVCTTPKPGLVDRMNSGSHTDMDIFTFLRSTAALEPYFEQALRIGRDGGNFDALRLAGMDAEGAMLEATGNVNTHKGAIFSLGIFCCALGRLERSQWADVDRVLAECAALAKGLTERDFAGITPENAVTAGQRIYAQYGITGVRGQAEAGFPAVRDVGLPRLEKGLALGKPLEEAGCAAMLAMLCAAEDTNLIARGGMGAWKSAVEQVRTLLRQQEFPDREALRQLDADWTRKNLSPGGSADLLAMCYFLHFLKEDAPWANT